MFLCRVPLRSDQKKSVIGTEIRARWKSVLDEVMEATVECVRDELVRLAASGTGGAELKSQVRAVMLEWKAAGLSVVRIRARTTELRGSLHTPGHLLAETAVGSAISPLRHVHGVICLECDTP